MANRPRTRSRALNERLSDRLSELPSCIILDILGRVPMRDAVRTCVLSKQWRYTWTTLPCLLFQFAVDDVDGDGLEIFTNSTTKFVDNVLLHHQGSINRVEMTCPYRYSINSFEKWVLCLSSKEVRELTIVVHSDGNRCCSLKSSIYKCARLIKLKLKCFKLTAPPASFKGLLDLKSIVFHGVTMSPAGFERLVGHCPVLEGLSVVSCSMEELRIRSSRLKDLQISGSQYKKLSLDAPLLEQIDVDLSWWSGSRYGCNFTNFLGSSANLVELKGDGFFSLFLSIDIESCQTSLMFPHLKVLDLQGMGLDYFMREISVLARLIIGAPNLQKLKIQAMCFVTVGPLHLGSRDYFGFPPDLTLEKLKEVSIISVWHYPTGMQFVKFLLERSPALEIMELQLTTQCPFKKMSDDVLGFHRASSNVEITFIKV